MQEKVHMLIFEGGYYTTEIENKLAQVRQAVVVDLIDLAKKVRDIDRIILVTNHRELADIAGKMGALVEMDAPDKKFFFGESLRNVINKYHMENVIYFGGGAAPLITSDDLMKLAVALREQKNVVLTNNFDSADYVAFTPGMAINQITPDHMDNTLPKRLHNQAGLRLGVLENNLTNAFDIDTVMDALVLGVQPRTGVRTRKAIRDLQFDLSPLQAAKKMLVTPGKNVLIYGRVNPNTMAYINSNAKCHLRILSEERNMRALGRIERKEVVSLLGYIMEKISPEACVEALEQICDCALIDTRVLFAHFAKDVSTSDRFYSDISMYNEIEDAFVRHFTKVLSEAKIPIVCGGHTLVNGGVWALLDAAMVEELEHSTDSKHICRLVIESGSPLLGLNIDTVMNFWGLHLKVVAWSDANNTLVDPPLDQLLSAGEVLYVIGDPDEVEFFKNYVVSENILD